jgi:hypothetical protein
VGKREIYKRGGNLQEKVGDVSETQTENEERKGLRGRRCQGERGEGRREARRGRAGRGETEKGER